MYCISESFVDYDGYSISSNLFNLYITYLSLFNLYAEYIIGIAGWMEHKLESRLPGEISITSDMQMTPPLWQKAKRKSLDESERGE